MPWQPAFYLRPPGSVLTVSQFLRWLDSPLQSVGGLPRLGTRRSCPGCLQEFLTVVSWEATTDTIQVPYCWRVESPVAVFSHSTSHRWSLAKPWLEKPSYERVAPKTSPLKVLLNSSLDLCQCRPLRSAALLGRSFKKLKAHTPVE